MFGRKGLLTQQKKDKKIIFGFLGLVLIVAYSNIVWASLEDGLVAYFPLNINASDASGNGHDGSEYGGVAYVDSMMGGAAEFDGLNDYIDIPYTAAIEPSVFSISLWMKSDKQDKQTLISTNDNNSCSHGYNIIIRQDGFSSIGIDPSSGCGSIAVFIRSDDIINDGAWHHLVAIYDGDYTLSMYIDDIFQSDMDAGDYAKPHRSIRIGMQRDPNDITKRYYLKGCVDEVRIYNRVLTEPEIHQFYTEALLTADAGPDQMVYDEITMDGSQSNDPNNTIISYDWTLIHRENPDYDRMAEGVNPTITNLAYGFYEVTLTVENDSGSVNTDKMVATAIGCKGDFDSDGNVDGSDLAEFAANFACTDCPSCQ